MFNEFDNSDDIFVASDAVVPDARPGGRVRASTSPRTAFRIAPSAMALCLAASFFVWGRPSGPDGRYTTAESHYSESMRDERVREATKAAVALRLVHDASVLSRITTADADEPAMVDPDYGM